MKIVAIVHEADTHLGLFAKCLEERSVDVLEWTFAVDRGDPPLDVDGLVVLGGSMNIQDELAHPWLRREKVFLRDALAAGIPTLGVCLGGQLLADALGAWVGYMPEPVVSVGTVTLTAAGAEDDILGRLPSTFLAPQWHEQCFTCPPDATLLATAGEVPQAFRLGSAWGLQFHPEATPDMLAEWAIASSSGSGSAERRSGMAAAERAAVVESLTAAVGRTICQRFIDVAERRFLTTP